MKKVLSISIIDDEILWPVQIKIYMDSSYIWWLSFENNGNDCKKRSELISRHFMNDDEILSIAKMDSLG